MLIQLPSFQPPAVILLPDDSWSTDNMGAFEVATNLAYTMKYLHTASNQVMMAPSIVAL